DTLLDTKADWAAEGKFLGETFYNAMVDGYMISVSGLGPGTDGPQSLSRAEHVALINGVVANLRKEIAAAE
ncbi:MAG: hypothetical protein ACI379_06855, partial [Nocardioides sp.]|uniref:hypothetical protein n=1 Tax=Nocardioides sp. TaxID=35761 RepID=UPI003F0E90DA